MIQFIALLAAVDGFTKVRNKDREKDIVMIYEIRTYWAAPDKIEALLNRFRKLTLPLFARHNMQLIGFWTPDEAGEENGDLIYILGFENLQAQEQAWQAFRQDPEWLEGKAASEVTGILTAKVVSKILLPTDFSPLK